MHTKKRRLKTGLKINYTAQTIVSELDEGVPRNLDYLISVNLLTSYILLLACKAKESLEFLQISERIANKLLCVSQQRTRAAAVNFDATTNEQSFFGSKPSQITGMLLSNYFLTINLMFSVAAKIDNPQDFDKKHQAQLSRLEKVEEVLHSPEMIEVQPIPLSHLVC